MANILIIDDEDSIRAVLSQILEDEGHSIEMAGSAEEGLDLIRKRSFDLIFLDVWLPGMDGLTLVEQISTAGKLPPIIMISGHGTVETAVRATRLGAYDFLEKPLSLDRVLLTVKHALADRRLRDRVKTMHQATFDEVLIGDSEPMHRLREQISTAAPTQVRVLITGENGSGKEIVARMLHRQSLRADEPFVDVNCAAIPEELIESELFGHRKGAFTGAIEDKKGKFELADDGTLFLDEIGDMSLKTQAKVLRVLQEQQLQRVGGQSIVKVDVRVIAATNKDLRREIEEGGFREDLFFRLNVIPIHVPPLRERGGDVIQLAQHFLHRFASEMGRVPKVLSSHAAADLQSHQWPGNVRELRNLMERLTILVSGSTIERKDLELERQDRLAAVLDTSLPLKEAREKFEREYILRKLKDLGGNVSRTAEALGVERSNLYRKLNAYGIQVERG
ncbi:MAG: sigma-54 dependent transcriptional regulator [Acidobacteria bacterium]|nr:sigma-54 dependent transcriptional regulator [Acidobacteriota bacterium]